jgi:hypothetical protein
MYRSSPYASPGDRKANSRTIGALVRQAGGLKPRPDIAERFRFGRTTTGNQPSKKPDQLNLL